jgi:predicted O-methyltransferase YrrM
MPVKKKLPVKNLSISTGIKQIETCHLGLPRNTFEIDSRDESSYIHEHLTTLNFIVSEFKLKNILEIGTGPGESLVAMIEGNDTHVTTIDIEACWEAKHKIINGNFSGQVTFVRGNSDTLGLTGSWDLVLIDGGHTENQVRRDIDEFAGQVIDGGFLVFHDTTNPAWPGVDLAVRDFADNNENWSRYQWFNCNGLVILKRNKDGC